MFQLKISSLLGAANKIEEQTECMDTRYKTLFNLTYHVDTLDIANSNHITLRNKIHTRLFQDGAHKKLINLYFSKLMCFLNFFLINFLNQSDTNVLILINIYSLYQKVEHNKTQNYVLGFIMLNVHGTKQPMHQHQYELI